MSRVTGLVLLVCFLGCQTEQGKMELNTDKEKASYSMGVSIGKTLKDQDVDLDAKAFATGFRDVFEGEERLMSESEMSDALMVLHKRMTEAEAVDKPAGGEAASGVAERNRKEGEAFLKENMTKEGVVTLPSGLQYKVLKRGTGGSPTATQTVSAHYRGRLINGTEFDSSYNRGKPLDIGVNQVIAGWTEALQLMKVGGKWELYIPSDLAYGPRGSGGTIGPNSTLIFEVELVAIK